TRVLAENVPVRPSRLLERILDDAGQPLADRAEERVPGIHYLVTRVGAPVVVVIGWRRLAIRRRRVVLRWRRAIVALVGLRRRLRIRSVIRGVLRHVVPIGVRGRAWRRRNVGVAVAVALRAIGVVGAVRLIGTIRIVLVRRLLWVGASATVA